MTALILVVDDLLPNLQLLEAKLHSEYYNVITAKSGMEALEIINNNNIDVILLDVMMPQMDGFEVCKIIKGNPKTFHIPIIMVTALNDIQDRVHGLEMGADDFLTKPVNDIALFARIKSLTRLKFIADELRMRITTGNDLGENFSLEAYFDISTITVLLIDDDNIQVEYITTIFKQSNIKLNICSIQADIIDAAQRSNPDIIIISTQMMKIDGLRLCAQFRGTENFRNTPILVLVDEDETNIWLKSLEIGANDYIVTPFDKNELVARTKTQIKKSCYQNILKNSYYNSIKLAFTDQLTGLYNRRYFDTHLNNLLAAAQQNKKPILLTVIDIDFFKKINDSYGHVAGDDVLKQVAEVIRNSVRVTDLAVRYGGEEFVIIMPSFTNTETALNTAERVRHDIESYNFKISVSPYNINATISMGATISEETDNPTTLFSRADNNLYTSKEKGRNMITFS